MAVVAAVNAAVLLVGLVGAFVVEPTSGGGGSVAASSGLPDGVIDTGEPTAPGPTEAASETGSTSPGNPKRPAAATMSTTVQPPTDAVKAAAEGTYRRRVDWTFERPMHRKGGGETTTRVSTTARSAGEVRQRHETRYVSTDDENDGRPTFGVGPRDIRWTVVGVFGTSAASGSRSCEPAETLELQLPLAAGARWTTTAACTYEHSRGRSTSRTTTASVVTGARQVTVAGQSRTVWEIVAESTSTVDGEPSGATTTETTMLFSPELGVDVRTDTNVSNPMFGIATTTQLVGVALD